MIAKEVLLREKQRYNLPLKITASEFELLKLDTPVQKIIGYIIMQDVTIFLQEKVLIPRYETEEVILKAFEFINKDSYVLDLCCGSGIIGLAIAKKTKAKVVLSDIDINAVKQANFNAHYNDLDVEIIVSDLFTNLQGKFDVIVSNPPYIPEEIILPKSVSKHEPHHALFAPNKGNWFYRKILQKAPTFLKSGGVIIFEISPWNLEFFNEVKNCQIFKDINQKERIAVIKF